MNTLSVCNPTVGAAAGTLARGRAGCREVADVPAGRAGAAQSDQQPDELLGELSRSQRSSALGASHDVRQHTTGTRRFRHRVVGDPSLAHEGLELPGDPGRTLVTSTAEPDPASSEAQGLLAGWASSLQVEAPHEAPSST